MLQNRNSMINTFWKCKPNVIFLIIHNTHDWIKPLKSYIKESFWTLYNPQWLDICRIRILRETWNCLWGVPIMAQWKKIWLVSMWTEVPSVAFLSRLRILCCLELCVSPRHGSDLALLWLWHRSEDTAPIRPLAWKPPYAVDAGLKRQKKKKERKREKRKYMCVKGCLVV